MTDHNKVEINKLKAEATKEYQNKHFESSLQLWKKILQLDPKNPFAAIYTRRIQNEISKAHDSPPIAQEEQLEENGKKIKVMVVDDSLMMRKMISKMLNSHGNIEVVESVANGDKALRALEAVDCDVVTLDLNMPEMDGLTVLKQIMINFPKPVIMLSAFTEKGASTTYDCLYYGALDTFCKPSRSTGGLEGQKKQFCQKIFYANKVEVSAPRRARLTKKTAILQKQELQRDPAEWVVAMGAGEGGPHTYLKIIPNLPSKIPGAILCIQSMEPEHLDGFCDYFNNCSRVLVKKAEDGELIRQGVCYITHDGNYLKIERSTEGLHCQVTPKPPLISQQNVLNQLFFSVGEKYGSRSIGVLLTGDGVDGVEGLEELKRMKATILVQDPKTALMNQAIHSAIQRDCVDKVVKDVDIPALIWHILKGKVIS